MDAEHAPTEAETKARDASASPAATEAEAGVPPQAAQSPHVTQGGQLAPAYYVAPPEETYARDTFAPVVPPIALGVIAFVIVGLILWAGTRMMQNASHNGYAQSMNREMGDGDNANAPFAPMPPGFVGAGRGTPARAATVQAPPAFNRALVTGPFLGDRSRQAAKDSLQVLHTLIAIFHKLDANGLWLDASSTGGAFGPPAAAPRSAPALPPGGVAPLTFPGAPTAVGAGSGSVAQTRGATFQGSGSATGATNTVAAAEGFADAVDHIHGRVEALATQVNMTTMPEDYPVPLRANVKTVSQELRAYLKDAEIAPAQDAETRALLRQRASQRLTNAEQMLTYMDGVVDGAADAEHPPRFANMNH